MHSTIVVALGASDEFDRRVHGTTECPALRSYDDTSIVTKSGATKSGAPAAVLSFTVDVDGRRVRAQTVVTVRSLLGALSLMRAYYGEE